MKNLKGYFPAIAYTVSLTFALSIPSPLFASASYSEWMEMVRACETVILDQDFEPLEDYETAPFTYGMPGIREFGVYNTSRSLIVTAREERGKWVHCLVREAKEERSVWREQAAQWENGFLDSFPQSEYVRIKWPYNPIAPFRGALLCRGDKPLLLVAPFLGDMVFRISVHNDLSHHAFEECEKRSAQQSIAE